MKKFIGNLKLDLIFYLNYLKKKKEFKEVIEILEIILDESKVPKEAQEQIPRLQELSEKTDSQSVEAAYLLGMIYRYGIGIPKDYKKAAEYFQTAVSSEHAPAQRELGYCYELGVGVDPNLILATALYKLSASQNWAPAFYFLAQACEYGSGVSMDRELAFAYYDRAAQQGYALAENDLALCYKHGFGCARDSKRVVELFHSAAQKGSSVAQNNLACSYSKGDGVEKDLEKSIFYFRLALAQGNPDAQRDLSVLYSMGTELRTDFKRQLELSTISAGQGNLLAQYGLGKYYLLGSQSIPNFERAILLLLSAKNDKGNEAPLRELVKLYGSRNNIPDFEAFVCNIFKSAFEFDKNITQVKDINDLNKIKYIAHPDDKAIVALCNAAYCFQMGLGVIQNFKAAGQLYFRAIEYYKKKGNLEAISHLHWDLYFCYQIQNQRQSQTKTFDTRILPEFHEKIKWSVDEGNINDLELLGYMNEKSDLNLEGNWYAAVQCYHQYFNHLQKELKGRCAAADDPKIELEMDEDWLKSLKGLRFQKSRKTPKELLQRRIAYSDAKLGNFTPLVELQKIIQNSTALNPSIAALVVSYARDTDVQKLKI